MDIMIQSLNQTYKAGSGYSSPIADTFNSQSMLERYIKARLTNRQTIRILLDQDQLQEEQAAIADDIVNRVMNTFKQKIL